MIGELSQLIRLNPQDPRNYVQRGHAWGAKSEPDKAVKDFDEAVRLDPKYAAAYAGRGGIWYEKHDFDKAMSDVNRAITSSSRTATHSPVAALSGM